MKHIRPKSKRAVQKINTVQDIEQNRREMDKVVFDIVLKTLYNNADKDVLHLENEIYAPSNIKLPIKEAERLWEVMISSGWVSPVVGFGNSGKVELTKNGYQLMSQYGGYSQFLAASQNNNQPQTIILPLQIQQQEEPAEEVHPLPPAKKGKAARTGGK